MNREPEQTPKSPLSQRLREMLAPLHDAIERTALARRMAGGQVGRAEYVGLLQNLHGLHNALETALAKTPSVAPWLTPAAQRTAALAADLAFWQAEAAEGLQKQRRLSEHFERSAKTRPTAILGALYIFEGSRMGARVLRRSVARALGSEDALNQGLDYFVVGADEQAHRWSQFKRQLEQPSWSRREERNVLAGARHTMRGLLAIYRLVGGEREGRQSSCTR
jgi:heme oxygenase